MAHSFIGKPISLISHSDVRYRGILAGIDPHASTIQLSNVYSMGTESRRPAAQYIPPMAEPYQYIIFKASEVKDLSVDEPVAAAQRNVHDDPAVMASAPIAAAPAPGYVPQGGPVPPMAQAQQYPPRPPQQPQQAPVPPQQPPVAAHQQQQQNGSPAPPQDASGPPMGNGAPRSQQPSQTRRPNPVHSATASLENVERALGDLRLSGSSAGASHRGGRRGRGPRDAEQPITVPKTDFDFASANAKFDKSALAPAASPDASEHAQGEEGGAHEADGAEGEDKKEKGPVAYNPKASFFDTLSSNAVPDNSNNNRGVGGRGRGRGGRSRRDEEREKNVATFGEPGGVGLMGPGAYVGGWGGYGRRGGRGRRGGPGGRGGAAQNQAVQARG